MPTNRVLEWLLEETQPSVRYLTLRRLLDRPENDPEVQAARLRMPQVGWGAEILGERKPGGWWVDPTSLYRPKYLSTNWKLLVLSDLGFTRASPLVRQSCELWIERFGKRDGGFGADGSSKSHLCIAGNTARALIKFGYADHPSVRGAFDWLAEAANKNGGWSCWGAGRNLDSWEGLSAFAAYPRSRWTPAMEGCVGKAAGFYLERELHRQGPRYEPWYRFHYPIHYYYDVLVGLDVLTSLGHAGDPRLGFALNLLRKKRRKDGRWDLDGVHPDVEGPIAAWMKAHPRQRPTPWALETPGRPSKMITLTALTVLARVDQAS